MNYSKLTNEIALADESNYTHSRNGYNVCKITPHHMYAVWTGKRCAESFQNPERNASANYCIGNDGDIVLNVPEEYRAWTSANYYNDSMAITIEVSNSSMEYPYKISDKAWNSLVNLCVDICIRYNFRLTFDGTKNGSLTAHRFFEKTSCPGDYLYGRFNELVKTVNARLSGDVPTQPTQPTTPTEMNRTDQILEVGSYVKIDDTFTITHVDAKNNLVGISALTDGEPTEPYHWFDPTAMDEVNGNGIKAGDQVLNVGEKCHISGTYMVLDVDIPTDSCRIHMGNRDVWVLCKYCTEVESITLNPTPTDGNSNANVTNADQVLYKNSKVVINGVYSVNEVIVPNSKYPNGAIGCYATCYGAPVGANDYIPCGVLATCDSNGNNADYNGVMKVGGHWCCNKEFTVIAVTGITAINPNGVVTLVADGVSFNIDPAVLFETKDA